MKSYRYIARDLSAVRKQGLTEAASAQDVVNWLHQQSLTPVSVDEVSESAGKSRRRSQRRIKSGDLVAFCSQLTTMVGAGIPVAAALDTIAEDTENIQLQEVLQQVTERIQKGEPFSESIARFPKLFNQLSCAIILAGETGGNLSAALSRLTEYFENRDQLKKKIKGAITYPVFIFSFITLMVIFIMTFIIPRFRVIFDELGGEMPAFSRAFMGFHDVLCHNLAYIAGSFVFLTTSAVLFSKTKAGHSLYSRIALGVPLVGKVSIAAFIAVFCRTMATLLAAGVSVLEVFDVLSRMTNNDVIKSAIVRAREHIVGGSSVSSSMASAGFFPNMVVHMVRVGEESSSLSTVLERTAKYYERRVDETITTVMSLLEPIMILIVGAIVSVVVLALYLPIFTMSDIAG